MKITSDSRSAAATCWCIVACLALVSSGAVDGRAIADHGSPSGVIEPAVDGERSRRPPVEGQWMPDIMPSNDLTDPPRNYPRCEGGACFGMATLTFALWSSRMRPATASVEEAAAAAIGSQMPTARGQFVNVELPSHVVLAGEPTPITDRAALVAVAETIQLAIQPGGGLKKTISQIRQIHSEAPNFRDRVVTADDLVRRIQESGGRLVMGLLYFNNDLTEMAGHAVIFTLGKDGSVYVWDPNADMTTGARGGPEPAQVSFGLDRFDRIQWVRYAIDLPDGRIQRREFNFTFPATTFIDAQQARALLD